MDGSSLKPIPIDQLVSLVGMEVGHSPWRQVTQEPDMVAATIRRTIEALQAA